MKIEPSCLFGIGYSWPCGVGIKHYRQLRTSTIAELESQWLLGDNSSICLSFIYKIDAQVSVTPMAHDHFGPMKLEDAVWLLSDEYMLDTRVSGRFRWSQQASQRQLLS